MNCIRCEKEIDYPSKSLAHNMDDYNVLLCTRDDRHFALIAYFHPEPFDRLLSRIAKARNIEAQQLKAGGPTTPDVWTIIPSILKPCICGGRYEIPWSEICKDCIHSEAPALIEQASIKGGHVPRDPWLSDVAERLQAIIKTYEIL